MRWESRQHLLWTTLTLHKHLHKHKETEKGRRRKVTLHLHTCHPGVWMCSITQYFLVLKVFKILNYSEGLFFTSATCEIYFSAELLSRMSRADLGMCHTMGDSSIFLCLPGWDDMDGLERFNWEIPAPFLRAKASGSLWCCLVFSKTFWPLCCPSSACRIRHFSGSCLPTKLRWVWGQELPSLQLFTCGLLPPLLLPCGCPS